MRGAFVMFEGLPPTVIDSQVLAHVRLAREVCGIDLAVVAVACTKGLYKSSQDRLERARNVAGGTVELIRGVRPALPGSVRINRVLLARALQRLGSLSFVHARADYAAAVTGPWTQQRGLPMLWDCRGDSRAELHDRFYGRAPVMLWYRLLLLQRELAIAGRTCAGACFVTAQLRDLQVPHMNGQSTWVIPCLAPEGEFFFDPALRARLRQELRIAADEAVYVYSGSLIAYQRFDETVAMFRRTLAEGQKARLIVLTPDVEHARQRCADLPAGSVICKSVGFGEVNGYLNASDFGMMLRGPSPVNVVAFPTKFAEYAMAGLKVIMQEMPPACVSIARELGNYLPLGAPARPSSMEERARVSTQAAQRLGRRAAMSTYAEIYRRLTQGRPSPYKA